MSLTDLRTKIAEAKARYDALRDRGDAPPELVEEAQDAWLDAQHDLWVAEGN